MFGRPIWALSKTHIATASIIVLAVFVPDSVLAATNIATSTFPNTGTVTWTKAGSPYVVTMPVSKRFGSFSIEPGVVVKFMPDATLSSHADVVTTIVGTPEEPIYFTSFKDDSVGGDTNSDGSATVPAPGDWGHVSFGGGAINNTMSLGYIKVRYGGGLTINTVLGTKRPMLQISYPWFTGSPGVGYILQNIEASHSLGVGLYVSVGRNHGLTVTNSSLYANGTHGLFRGYSTDANGNLQTGAVSATGNWWGDITGPYHPSQNPTGLGNAIDATSVHPNLGGAISFVPWLSTDPLPDPAPEPSCCSSVLFLPGFMASRLYKDGEKLWEPGLSTDSTQLLMDQAGNPTVPGITAPEVLDAAGGTDIYDSFLQSLDQIVGPEEGKIHEWEAFPYDWRKAVNDPALLAALAAQVHQLAADSKTDEVSIVAHSNGGLLAKALMVYLGNTEADALVDKIIMVGSPQIGTPKAVGALLHGYEQGVPSFFPILLGEAEARTLAQNMHGAYGLIPSAAYFNTVTEPMITFEGTNSPFIDQMIAAYEPVVGNITEYREFLTGAEGRTDPSEGDLVHPEVLRTQQFDAAQALHTSIDAWTPPAGIEVYQIAGWGEETVKGFDYIGREVCLEGVCFEQIRTLPQMTMDGDGTVVTPSALYISTAQSNVHRYWLDLYEYNAQFPDKNHGTIFSATSVLDFTNSILKGQPQAVPFINVAAPVHPTEPRLRYFLHSPLHLSASNSNGQITSSELSQIPGARFEKFGEVQYVSVPASATPTLHLDAYAGGSFILDVQEVQGDAIINEVSFVGIPNTENTEVTMSFPDGTIANASPLLIDKNGDGTTDFSVSVSGVEVGLAKAPITVSAVSKSVIMGSAIPALTYTLSGFVAGETLETSDITGAPECITTATQASPVGTYPITCSAGTLQSDYYSFETFVAGTLTITYPWSGFQQPIDDPAATPGISPSVFKAGSTVPVKFKLRDSNGVIVEATVLPQWLTPTRGASLNGSVDEPVYSDPATTGNTYRYDPTNGQYIYNWKTNKSDAGYWYKIYAKLNDGTIKSVMVGLR